MKWDKKYLADVADFCLGKMLDQKKNRGDFLPYLANLNVQWGEFDLTDLRQMKFESHEIERYGLKYGDIVMCEGGEPGRCAIWQDQMPGMMIQKALHRIRPHACLDHRFLFYFFLLKGRMGGFSPLFTGSTIKHLPRQNLAKVEIDVPPLEIQNKIADILSKYDETIANNRRRIELLERSSRLLYREWFVYLRFPGHEHGAIDPDGIPEGWEKIPLGDVLTLQRGFDLPVAKRIEGNYPIYASTGINGYHEKLKVKAPGVVTGRSGSLGTVLYASEDFWPLNTTLWVKEFKKVDPIFAVYLLRNLHLEQYNGGAAVPTLNRNDVHRINVLCPSKRLLDLFHEFSSPIYEQNEKLNISNKKLQAARDLLLPRLMNGEINV